MKTLFYGIFSLLILSCASSESADVANDEVSERVEQNQPTAISKDISAEEFKQEMQDNPGQLIDVRTPEEFAGGYIEGATNINFYDSDFEEQLDGLDKSKPVYVYCKSGGRSGQAKTILTEKGFATVYNLIGGYSGWKF